MSRSHRSLRHELIEAERYRLRVDEFQPRVLSAFVRNKLISEVYLPIIGDNLAKQMGAAGDAKRTDLMGMLLLISPPGYGKTTLMEYIANRLGQVFVKVNGPALGHSVMSLDPEEAPNEYSVSLTYFDVDEDTVTIGSTDELVDAIEQFSGKKVL